MKKYIRIGLGVVMFLVVFCMWTNPTLREFKEYVPSEVNVNEADFKANATISRTENNLVYSVYEIRWNRTGKKAYFKAFIKSFTMTNYDQVHKLNRDIAIYREDQEE